MHTAIESNATAESPQLLEPHELRKFVLKLRWIGMENDAEYVRHALTSDMQADGSADTPGDIH